MKKIIRIFSFITALGLIFTFCGCKNEQNKETATKPTYQQGALCDKDSELKFENDDLILSLSYDTCDITVTEKKSKTVWKSNPDAGYEDTVATGITKTNLFSQIAVDYVGNTNALVKTNSYAGSVKKGTYKIFEIENGFRVEYEFDKGFTIPVSYTLDGGKFVASILYTGIKENENRISTIELLPYFGIADSSAKGFMLIPDGCGAVINFNNQKTDCAEYSKKVYGVDESLPNDIVTTREEQIYVPIIGMNKNGKSFVATATVGEAESYVNATVSGISSEFNSVYFKAVYRAAENLSVLNGSLGTAGLVLYAAENPSDAESFTVEYNFVKKENSTLGDMVTTAREDLLKKGEIVKSDDINKLYVDLYGGVTKAKSFLGIQYDGVETLTTIKQAQKLADKLLNSGCDNLAIGYKNYSKSYFNGGVQTDFAPHSALGSKKDIKNLLNYANEKDIELYFFADYYSLRNTGNGFSKYFDTTKGLDLGGIQVYPQKLNTNIPDTSADSYYLLKSSVFSTAANKLLKSAEKYGIDGIYLGDISSKISGDYALSGLKRSSATEKAEESAKILSGKNIITSSPNLYMWKYSDKAVNVPVFSSENHLFDYDVPFLQMLLKGSIPYAGYEIDLYNTHDDIILRHYAFGQGLHYGFMADESSDLQNTDMLSYYGLSDAKLNTSAENAKQLKDFYSHIKDLYIENYINYGSKTKTVYSNGTEVLVNYGEEDSKIGDVTVKAESYVVVANGRSLLTGGAVQ